MQGFRAVFSSFTKSVQELMGSQQNLPSSFMSEEGSQLALPSFYASLTSTLVPEVGSLPFWTTSGTATSARPTVVDRKGITRTCEIGEARFEGARRVFNLLRRSNALTTSPWTARGTGSVVENDYSGSNPDLVGTNDPLYYTITGNGLGNSLFQTCVRTGAGLQGGILRPVKHTFSLEMCSGSVSSAVIKLGVTGGGTAAASATVTLSSTWQRFAITGTPDGTSVYEVIISSASSGTINVRYIQLEDLAGETADASSNIPPSEYVSFDAITVTSQSINVYHGAMVDGVKYFETEHANTLNNTTKVVTEASGADITASLLKGCLLEPACTALTTGAETLSGWTINGATSCTVTTGAATGPDGLTSAIRITEVNGDVQSKYVYQAVSPTASKQFTAIIKAKAGTRSWLRLGLKRNNGATCTCWFNLTTGALGTVTSPAKAYIWPEGDGSSGWYYCAVVVDSSTGAAAEMHVGIANANGASGYTGVTGNYIDVWGALCFLKEHPQSYFNPDRFSTNVRPSTSLAYSALSLLGRNDFAFYAESVAYYDTGIINKTSDGSTQEWYKLLYFAARNPKANMNRMGITIRPYIDPTSGYAIWAFDCYLGDPTQALLWRANTVYSLGDYVVPQDTLSDNSNGKKIFTCVVAGTSGGTDPGAGWNTTYTSPPDTTSNLTVDGTVRWQCNELNSTDSGVYDPNDGCHPRINVAARTDIKMAYWKSSTPSFLVSVNGTTSPLTTAPFPIDQSQKGDLREEMYEMRVGRGATSTSISSQTMRNVIVWDHPVSWGALLAKTQ